MSATQKFFDAAWPMHRFGRVRVQEVVDAQRAPAKPQPKGSAPVMAEGRPQQGADSVGVPAAGAEQACEDETQPSSADATDDDADNTGWMPTLEEEYLLALEDQADAEMTGH